MPWAIDLATTPLQLPLLVPFWLPAIRAGHRSLRVQAALLSPETLEAVLDRAGVTELDQWEREFLEEACQREGIIRPRYVGTLIDLFSSDSYAGHGGRALATLIERQPVSADDLHRILAGQQNRDRYDRDLRVLMALARHRQTPRAVLEGLRELGGPGGHWRRAAERIAER